jgi:choline dehydrogenase-like flavoprotein
MLNFMVYTRGPAADWDRWADLVGDQEWSWEKAKERFRQVRRDSLFRPMNVLKLIRSRPFTTISIERFGSMSTQSRLTMDIMVASMFRFQRRSWRVKLGLPWMLVQNWG